MKFLQGRFNSATENPGIIFILTQIFYQGEVMDISLKGAEIYANKMNQRRKRI